ncbi:MAG: hybrid sensor histidine kinase/response regulator [Pseudomonadota bacterium]
MNSILVIEDANYLANMITQQIQRYHNMPTFIAGDYAEAELLLEKHREELFMAIVDISLPDAPNGEAIDLVLEYKIPVVVFTGRVEDSEREKIINKGVADYVLKNASHSIEYLLHLVHQIYRNRHIKVLVVDDSRMFRRIMCGYLKRQCFQVVEASSGKEALELLEIHDDVKLAVLDCFMDGMDGFELTSEIRRRFPKDALSIIGVSGKAGHTISAKFMKSGANDFIVKPFIAEEFFCRVNLSVDYIQNVKALKGANTQKNQLIGMVAHDIRGPLGSMVNAADIMIGAQLSEEKSKKMLGLISKTGQEMLKLVNELLDMSVVESGEFELSLEKADICELLNESITFYSEAAEKKGISFEIQIPERLEVEIDVARIKQVINNLISNAVKYSPQQSCVKITLKTQENSFLFEVYDQGKGIKEEEESRLFGAFQKLSSETTGGESSTGLGLAICKKMIDAHKGQIGYQKLEPLGCKFYFSVPLVHKKDT